MQIDVLVASSSVERDFETSELVVAFEYRERVEVVPRAMRAFSR